MDLHVNVPSVETEKLVGRAKVKSETSKVIQKRVQAARERQTKRFKSQKIKANSEMSTREVKKYCPLSSECRHLLRSAVSAMNLSARSYFKVVKVARTIADLAGEKTISTIHLAEALQYRPVDSDL